LGEMAVAGRHMGLQFQILKASTSREINAAFAAAMRERTDALFVLGDSLFTSRRVQLATLAAHHRIPAIYGAHEITEVGGLMSYASSIADAWRQVGLYTGSILKGTKPADLPVIQASKFELIINAETARILGLEIPPTLLARADEVIE
jgi:putative ABC transport system substrate-binding protein